MMKFKQVELKLKFLLPVTFCVSLIFVVNSCSRDSSGSDSDSGELYFRVAYHGAENPRAMANCGLWRKL